MKNWMLTGLMLLLMAPAFAQDKDEILGKWASEHGSGQIEIYKSGGKYFGRLSWIKEPNDASGQPKTDIYNPVESLRSKPIVGLVILKNFGYNGKGVWDKGTVYNPKTGKTYSCKMTLQSHDKLNIRGFMGFSFAGKSEIWTRTQG